MECRPSLSSASLVESLRADLDELVNDKNTLGLLPRLSEIKKRYHDLETIIAEETLTAGILKKMEGILSDIKKVELEINELEELLERDEKEEVKPDSRMAEDTPTELSQSNSNNTNSAKSSVAPSIRARRRNSKEWTITPTVPAKATSHREEHEELTTDLVHMARRLKQNNLRLSEMVKEDKKVVEGVAEAMSGGVDKFGKEHRKLQEFEKAGRIGMFKMLILVAFVLLSVIFMFMLIILTKSH